MSHRRIQKPSFRWIYENPCCNILILRFISVYRVVNHGVFCARCIITLETLAHSAQRVPLVVLNIKGSNSKDKPPSRSHWRVLARSHEVRQSGSRMKTPRVVTILKFWRCRRQPKLRKFSQHGCFTVTNAVTWKCVKFLCLRNKLGLYSVNGVGKNCIRFKLNETQHFVMINLKQ